MEAQGENDELYPIAVLIDELKVYILPALNPPQQIHKPNRNPGSPSSVLGPI
jgi:hypothetical protein